MHSLTTTIITTSILSTTAFGLVTSSGDTTLTNTGELKTCVNELHDSPSWTGQAGYDCAGRNFYLTGNGHWGSAKDCIGSKCYDFLERAAGDGAEWAKCEQSAGSAACTVGWK